MSDLEDLLARWSRLKRDKGSQPEAAPSETTAEGEADRPAAGGPDAPPAFDPAGLPSIDAIEAGTDIRAFLAAGVPPDLALAALRRAWAADPAIRDFIGLAENSWDFNAPDAMPGFGPLNPKDVLRLLAQVIGEPEAATPARQDGAAAKSGDRDLTEAGEPKSVRPPSQRRAAVGPALPPAVEAQDDRDAAAHADAAPHKNADAPDRRESGGAADAPPRRHGSALPR